MKIELKVFPKPVYQAIHYPPLAKAEKRIIKSPIQIYHQNTCIRFVANKIMQLNMTDKPNEIDLAD